MRILLVEKQKFVFRGNVPTGRFSLPKNYFAVFIDSFTIDSCSLQNFCPVYLLQYAALRQNSVSF